MSKVIALLTILILSISATSFADDVQQVITLKDGSQIKGELAGIDNGVYTVKTPIIGDVHVAASDVASITNGNGAAVPAATLPTTAPVTPSQPTAGSSVDQQMAQDPEIMQALQDPALVQAVTSHDYQAVASNPKIQEMMNNPKMQELLKQLIAQQQQQNTSTQ